MSRHRHTVTEYRNALGWVLIVATAPLFLLDLAVREIVALVTK